ncbi:MAG: hypothetical protein AAGD05_00350 [Bacteroidota bacterium]
MKKNYLLGLGGQKCGTTWFYKFLASSEEVDFGFMKEYHVLDAHYTEYAHQFYEANLRKLHLLSNAELKEEQRLQQVSSLVAFTNDVDLYFDFFAGLLERKSNIKLTGDLTPSHSLLEEKDLSEIRVKVTSRGIGIRALQIVRDPIERVISASRHKFRVAGVQPSLTDEVIALYNDLDSPSDELRTRYKYVDMTARQVFADDYSLIFYEEMFNKTTLSKICEFLNIKPIDFDLDVKINASRIENRIPADVKRAIFLKYREIYEYFCDLYGYERMAKIWDGYEFFNEEGGSRDFYKEKLTVFGGVHEIAASRDEAIRDRDAAIAERDAAATECAQLRTELRKLSNNPLSNFFAWIDYKVHKNVAEWHFLSKRTRSRLSSAAAKRGSRWQ